MYAPPGETLPSGRYAFGGLREDDVRDDPAKAGGRYHAASFITFDLQLEDGNKVQGSYQGEYLLDE